MALGLTLVCPVRGPLKAKARGKDGLTPTEERFRVEVIRHLINRGYPKDHIRAEVVIKRFGNSGRSVFRADVIVLDRPIGSVPDDVNELLKHALVLAEVKRDNAEAGKALKYQVKPMLDFASRDDCLALYWDNVEQRVFWQIRRDGIREVREGPLADLPNYGGKLGATKLTFNTIDAEKPLLAVFKRIEDTLHAASLGPSKRFEIMLQLLLAKLYDEHLHQTQPDEPLTIQDFAALDTDALAVAKVVNRLLGQAIRYYQAFLPEPVQSTLPVNGEALLEIMKILAPIKIISMRQSVLQDFYMYFAKHIYKWDLAQYFTPTTVTDFIIEVLNPQWGEHVKDPACGSADFLTAAYRRGQHWPDYASSVWGSDKSREAVQVAILNMILNGDGKSNINCEDSLLKIEANAETCDVVVCNPPFGTKIVERNKQILQNFELARVWSRENDRWQMTSEIMEVQETGFLFVEACVRLLRSGGRLALVLPTGYLGNRSSRYIILRDWLLRHCRFAAIVGFPRFTFKGSGASVVPSVIFCEKRETPLQRVEDCDNYEIAVEIIDRVGWVTGDKRNAAVYKRDATDGTFLLDEGGQLILDSDFDSTLAAIRNSDAVQYHEWLTQGLAPKNAAPGWTVPAQQIVADPLLTLDPKRLSHKYLNLKSEIMAKPHFVLGDIAEFVTERTSSAGTRVKVDPARVYGHVEIQNVEIGSYRWHDRRGWELPDRAKHFAEPGDIYIGGIWNCVQKWFYVGVNATNLVVTNGMHRLRLKPEASRYLPDLIIGLCSEAFAVQMRALSRGSDGLAEIAAADAAEVVLPIINDQSVREDIQPFVDQLVAGFTTVEAKVSALQREGQLPLPAMPTRPDHTSLV
ncbi:MAG TPA: N-6 DNA methylase [Micromonosporaceae bacterium]|nr:N-6 DNA methylase [Micromonosporaceae bacterium]